jgi:hemerythrin-like domain-containing protein
LLDNEARADFTIVKTGSQEGVMAADPREQIIDLYRTEHRTVRDILLDLIDAFTARDKRKIKTLLKAFDEEVGPHMRCEEEAIYPALKKYYMDNQIEHLLTEHDLMIATLRKLYQLIERGPVTKEDARIAELHIRMILIHVIDCDGTMLLVELISDKKAKSILTARRRAEREGLSLLNYAAEARGRMLRASSLRVLFGGC